MRLICLPSPGSRTVAAGTYQTWTTAGGPSVPAGAPGSRGVSDRTSITIRAAGSSRTSARRSFKQE
jgi:hypothetical protein